MINRKAISSFKGVIFVVLWIGVILYIIVFSYVGTEEIDKRFNKRTYEADYWAHVYFSDGDKNGSLIPVTIQVQNRVINREILLIDINDQIEFIEICPILEPGKMTEIDLEYFAPYDAKELGVNVIYVELTLEKIYE